MGVLQPKDSCELHDLPLVCKVACKKRDDTDELTNVIKGYKKRDAVAAAILRRPASAAPAPADGSPPCAATVSTTPPWKRA